LSQQYLTVAQPLPSQAKKSVTEQSMLQAAPTNHPILNCPIPLSTWFQCGIIVTVLEG